jgi:alpha-tubulin suppressor-like RCC1 family protein
MMPLHRARALAILASALWFLATGPASQAATLQSIELTPVEPAVSAGKTQAFRAIGKYDDNVDRLLGGSAKKVASSYRTTCALLTDGRVQCWGLASDGQLGKQPTRLEDLLPTPIPQSVNGITTARDIDTGPFHACAVLAVGSVECWGRNSDGQLGNGSTERSFTPVAVSGVTNATAVALGDTHSCALLAGGQVQCWGGNDEGQLGDGATADSTTPVAVNDIATATAITAGFRHTCALLADGRVQCWGLNDSGQLGDGTTASSTTPVFVSGIATATQVAAGAVHTCALLESGQAQCWGNNQQGQLGDGASLDGTQTNSSTPVLVSGINPANQITAQQIGAGREHTCAVVRNPTGQIRVWCWGRGSEGQLGTGGFGIFSTPVTVNDVVNAKSITGGELHTCAVISDIELLCWGANGEAQLGNPIGSTTEGFPYEVAGMAGAVAWASSVPAVAEIDPLNGVAAALQPGITTITVTRDLTYALVESSTNLTVTPPDPNENKTPNIDPDGGATSPLMLGLLGLGLALRLLRPRHRRGNARR